MRNLKAKTLPWTLKVLGERVAKSITHLFVSFDKPIGEYDKYSNPDLRIVESHSETPEMILQGFAFYLSNMSSMDALAQAEKNMV